jgi:hypothetical protein
MMVSSTSVVDSSNTVYFSDLFPKYDVEQANTFLEELYGKTTGYVGLSAFASGAKKPSLHGFNRWSDVRKLLEEQKDFFSFSLNDWAKWNVYVQVGSTLRERPEKGQRGKASNALEQMGLFADFDVKPNNGTFATRAELDAFLTTLPEPTMLVNSAGPDGGVHVYWLYDEPQRVHNFQERHALDGWFDYLMHQAAAVGRVVDHVQEYARILRVPGTVRWPKKGAAGDPGVWKPVELVKHGGPRYRHADMLAFTEHYRRVAVERHETFRSEWRGVRDGQLDWLESLGLTRGAQGIWEGRFNDLQDWGPLLEAAGWKLHADNRGKGGSTDARYWTRPGKDTGESAMTDYKDSKVMVVYTTDSIIAPCLVPTADRFQNIVTKYSFALHFLAQGDESKLIRAISKNGGRLL